MAPRPTSAGLVQVRFIALAATAALSLGTCIAAAVVLAYSLRVYRGSYIKSNPASLASGGLGFVLALSSLTFGRKRLITKIWAEICWSGTISLLLLASGASLHKATPGLLGDCGHFFICRSLAALFVFSWLAWLAVTTLFTVVLVATIRRFVDLRKTPTGEALLRGRMEEWPRSSPVFRSSRFISRDVQDVGMSSVQGQRGEKEKRRSGSYLEM